MFAIVRLLAVLIANLFKSRRRLEAEILFLRHQLNIALRQRPTRLPLRSSDRALLVWMIRLWPSLLDMVQVVEPATILRWHRAGFKTYWRWKSRKRAGRPADTAFNVTSVGKRVFTPASGHVSRKFAIEHYFADLDIYELFTECRVGGMNFNLPATGMATVEIPLMGRDMETGSAGSAPFFTAPSDVTGTGILAAVNGLIRVRRQGVITGAQVNINLSPELPAVVGQNFVPEIFLGRTEVSGQITAFFEDLTLVNYFRNETEISVLLYLLASSVDAADAMTIFLPKVIS